MKSLVTHINPHLDDIAAIWLFKKFHPEFKEALVEFISQSKTDEVKDESEERVYLGVGKGKFDEHKGDKDDCATSLVWAYLRKNVSNDIELLAIDELVEWVRLIDLGRLPAGLYDDFSVQAFIRPDDSTQSGSTEAVDLGGKILDRIYNVLIEKHKSQKEWEKRIEFETKFGKTFAVEGVSVNRAFCKAQGVGELFIIYNPENRWAQYFTPSFETDLEDIYKKLKISDPTSDWFLHQSHHMVICGSGSSPDSKGTKLSFEDLIELVKSI